MVIPIDSEMEGKIFPLHVLAELLKPEGTANGSNLDYEHSFFEVNVLERGDVYYLRIPFYAVAGSLDYPGVTVRVKHPYMVQQRFGEEEMESAVERISKQPPGKAATDVNDIGISVVKKVESKLFPGR